MKLLILIMLAVPAWAQIHIHATPESLSSNILGMKNVGTWNVGLTNMTQCSATISANMLMTSLPRLHPINTARAKQLNQQAYNSSKRSKMIRLISFIGPLAVAIIGGQLINMTVQTALKATTATSLGVTAIQTYGSYLQSQQPNESLLDPNVPELMKLAPFGQDGFSPTFTLISGKIKNADTMDADIAYPISCSLVISQTQMKPTAVLEPFSALPVINSTSWMWGF